VEEEILKIFENYVLCRMYGGNKNEKGMEIDYLVNHFMLSNLHLGEFFPIIFFAAYFWLQKLW